MSFGDECDQFLWVLRWRWWRDKC